MVRKMAKIKEIVDNNLEVKFKKFKKITGYFLWGKQSWNIGK